LGFQLNETFPTKSK